MVKGGMCQYFGLCLLICRLLFHGLACRDCMRQQWMLPPWQFLVTSPHPKRWIPREVSCVPVVIG